MYLAAFFHRRKLLFDLLHQLLDSADFLAFFFTVFEDLFYLREFIYEKLTLAMLSYCK
jgi:hypothetical protein